MTVGSIVAVRSAEAVGSTVAVAGKRTEVEVAVGAGFVASISSVVQFASISSAMTADSGRYFFTLITLSPVKLGQRQHAEQCVRRYRLHALASAFTAHYPEP